ncbi:hypothetical protein B0H19DRAFT_1385135, partial [Mycena capillaripes]
MSWTATPTTTTDDYLPGAHFYSSPQGSNTTIMLEDKYIGLALAVAGSVAIGTSTVITKMVSLERGYATSSPSTSHHLVVVIAWMSYSGLLRSSASSAVLLPCAPS